MYRTSFSINRKGIVTMDKKGSFIVFEGIDGCGKTTQLDRLAARITRTGHRVTTAREPSDGPIGTLLRQFLTGRLQGEEDTIAALFAADRLDHLHNPVNGVSQLLDSGVSVLCDRYLFSSYAYQGTALDPDWIVQLNSQATRILRPACHIFLDVTADVSMERMAKGRVSLELFETRERLNAVRDRYLTLFDEWKDRENILIIDGNQTPETISEQIWSHVSEYFL